MINQIFETLASDNGRNFKIDYLKQHKDIPQLKKAIFLALNPYTQFFIRKIPAYTTGEITNSLDYAMSEVSRLASREYTGNAAIEHLTNVLSSISPSDAKVIERIIEKDLKCGVSESTVNKVWPGLIPEYPCMLASAYEDKLVQKVNWPAFVQVKMDGMRFNAIVKNGKCEFRSRNGKLIDIPSTLIGAPFIHMARFWGCDMVFDGELLVVDISGSKPLDRKTGNGILNKAVKGTMSGDEALDVRATLWDAIPLENFAEGKFDEPYSIRIAKLSNALSDMKEKSGVGYLASLVWHKEVKDKEEAQALFEKFLGEGQEGIILKTRDGIWEDKRAKHQIKFKGEYECDLICTAWEEGTGKNAGRLGALQLESACGKLKVGVGSGLTDADRDNITPDVVGKVITVKYNAIVDDKTKDTKSLFLPIFLEVREDKDTADTLDKLKG